MNTILTLVEALADETVLRLFLNALDDLLAWLALKPTADSFRETLRISLMYRLEIFILRIYLLSLMMLQKWDCLAYWPGEISLY